MLVDVRSGITSGMTRVHKVAISLPVAIAEKARRAVKEGKAASLSALVADALDEKLDDDSLETMLAEALERTGGPMTKAEAAWADRMLGIAPKKPRRRRARSR